MAGASACTAMRTFWKNDSRPPWKAGFWRAVEIPFSPTSMICPTSGKIVERVGARDTNAWPSEPTPWKA
jgi:hypothetical protein